MRRMACLPATPRTWAPAAATLAGIPCTCRYYGACPPPHIALTGALIILCAVGIIGRTPLHGYTLPPCVTGRGVA